MTTAVTSTGPFRRRTLWILIAVGVVSLGVALFLAAFADDFQDHPTADANGYSRSAIGYKALVELLEKSGIPVLVSQHDSGNRARDGLLVVFAPDTDPDKASQELTQTIAGAPRVLVILPRWWGEPSEDNEGWIDRREELPIDDAQRVLDQLGLTGTVERDGTAQTIDGHESMTGQVDGSAITVIADPSGWDNAGLRQPGRARAAVALIQTLRANGPVVFDETSHGFEDTPSLWRALFRFPLVLVTLHVLLGAVLLLWAAVGRWGPPRGDAPATRSGKDFLIKNTAELLHVGGHDGDALRRYLATTIIGVKVALHAPRDLDAANLRGWLERVRAERGCSISIIELEREVWDAAHAKKNRAGAKRIVELAARVHRWRSEMTHGPR